MTNEEAREFVVQSVKDDVDIAKVADAIQALEKQPSEDCISREALINELKLGYFNKDLQEGKNDPCVIDAMIDWAIRTIKRQPSVTPQPKIGKWIKIKPYPLQMHDYECSECGHETDNSTENYCSECGAKMEREE